MHLAYIDQQNVPNIYTGDNIILLIITPYNRKLPNYKKHLSAFRIPLNSWDKSPTNIPIFQYFELWSKAELNILKYLLIMITHTIRNKQCKY